MRWVRHVVFMGEIRSAYKMLVGKRERKRPFGRKRDTLEYNIRMDLTEIWRHGMDWFHLAQDRDQ
jgi:hypothetical protein